MPDYSPIVRRAVKRYEIRVKRWRKQMSGKAWRVHHDDGRVVNWVEAPRPKTPLSLAIFLHEVGHHAVGFDKFRLRCEEEFYVWIWALREMRRRGVEPDARVLRRVDNSMRYAVAKALRRGIKKLPQTLIPYLPA